MGAVIEVDDLTKSYGSTRAVDGVSLRVEQGEFFGILGPNGAGKTTFLEIVEGLRPRDSQLAGHQWTHSRPDHPLHGRGRDPLRPGSGDGSSRSSRQTRR